MVILAKGDLCDSRRIDCLYRHGRIQQILLHVLYARDEHDKPLAGS